MLGAIRRYSGAFLGILLFAAINLYHLLRPVTCWDCFFPFGLPFTFYQEGGYAGGAGVVWKGLMPDLLILVLVTTLAQYAWTRLARNWEQSLKGR
jgi:hypothetical protein